MAQERRITSADRLDRDDHPRQRTAQGCAGIVIHPQSAQRDKDMGQGRRMGLRYKYGMGIGAGRRDERLYGAARQLRGTRLAGLHRARTAVLSRCQGTDLHAVVLGERYGQHAHVLLSGGQRFPASRRHRRPEQHHDVGYGTGLSADRGLEAPLGVVPRGRHARGVEHTHSLPRACGQRCVDRRRQARGRSKQ